MWRRLKKQKTQDSQPSSSSFSTTAVSPFEPLQRKPAIKFDIPKSVEHPHAKGPSWADKYPPFVSAYDDLDASENEEGDPETIEIEEMPLSERHANMMEIAKLRKATIVRLINRERNIMTRLIKYAEEDLEKVETEMENVKSATKSWKRNKISEKRIKMLRTTKRDFVDAWIIFYTSLYFLHHHSLASEMGYKAIIESLVKRMEKIQSTFGENEIDWDDIRREGQQYVTSRLNPLKNAVKELNKVQGELNGLIQAPQKSNWETQFQKWQQLATPEDYNNPTVPSNLLIHDQITPQQRRECLDQYRYLTVQIENYKGKIAKWEGVHNLFKMPKE